MQPDDNQNKKPKVSDNHSKFILKRVWQDENS